SGRYTELSSIMDHPRDLSVLMVGPSRSARGGIASVIDGFFDAGFPPGVNVNHVVTSSQGSIADKAITASRGILAATKALGDTDVVHAHASSGPSFARKALAPAAP